MNDTDYTPPSSITCSHCHAGMMSPRHVTFFTWLGSELITVPQFPAWICDVCGRREYDEKAVQWLNMILNPNAGTPTPNHRRTPPPFRPRAGGPRPIPDS